MGLCHAATDSDAKEGLPTKTAAKEQSRRDRCRSDKIDEVLRREASASSLGKSMMLVTAFTGARGAGVVNMFNTIALADPVASIGSHTEAENIMGEQKISSPREHVLKCTALPSTPLLGVTHVKVILVPDGMYKQMRRSHIENVHALLYIVDACSYAEMRADHMSAMHHDLNVWADICALDRAAEHDRGTSKFVVLTNTAQLPQTQERIPFETVFPEVDKAVDEAVEDCISEMFLSHAGAGDAFSAQNMTRVLLCENTLDKNAVHQLWTQIQSDALDDEFRRSSLSVL